MLPDLEMRNFWYTTGMDIARIIFIAIVNFSMIKKKTIILSAPSILLTNKFGALAKKHKFFKIFASQYLWAAIEIFLISAIIIIIIPFFAVNFAKLVGTDANFFGYMYFFPLVFIALFILTGQHPLKNLDFFSFSVPVVLIFFKCACFCSGCCNSVWWPGGMYNYYTCREEIPIQLIEAFWALLTFIVIAIYEKKGKNRKVGELFPLVMILIGATRFVSEFWRSDAMVWKSFRYYHLFCAISVALGIIELIIVKKYSDKITMYFDNTIYFSRKLKDKLIGK